MGDGRRTRDRWWLDRDVKQWGILLAAIVAEVGGTLALRGAVDHPALYAIVGIGYVAAFALFGAALRAGLGVGIGYGIWGAVGVAAVAVASAILFREVLTATAWSGIALVMAGVLVVELGAVRAGRSATGAGGGDQGSLRTADGRDRR